MKPIFPSLRTVLRFAIAAALLFSLTACGNKGPLVPPKAMLAAEARA
jgi:predicted small lipoprotein YifL